VRHVARGTGVALKRGEHALVLRHGLGQAEVGQLQRGFARGQQHIDGLDISVHADGVFVVKEI
jgi:hypothetical protein